MEYKVVIYKHGGNYWLAGGQLAIKKKDTVHFYNSTEHTATITGDTVESDGWPSKAPIDLAPDQTGDVKFEMDGWFPYTVTVDGQEAQASKPIVIVYP